jgi:hypothetical protein
MRGKAEMVFDSAILSNDVLEEKSVVIAIAELISCTAS